MAEIESGFERQGHVVLDLPSRQWKAQKIERLLNLAEVPGPISMLEIGTGSGGIAHYFATHPSGKFRVHAVDTTDSRLVHEHYDFSIVGDATLPFPDDAFDVVLSNHVIEHVGDITEQRTHLRELRRVLRTDGRGYLAVPNRWMFTEPHYQLALLSWLPEKLRTPYLRFRGKGQVYDCRPLTAGAAEGLLREANLEFEQKTGAAIRLTYALETRAPGVAGRLLLMIPDFVFSALGSVIPTLIYVLKKSR